MSDFGDEVGSEISQAIRTYLMHSQHIHEFFQRSVVGGDGSDSPVDPRASVALDQLDFETPEAAQKFCEALRAKGIHSEVAQASLVIAKDDLDSFIATAQEHPIDGLPEIIHRHDVTPEPKPSAHKPSPGRGLDKPWTPAQKNFIHSLNAQGVISADELSSLGPHPTVKSANALLNAHRNKAGLINLDGSSKTSQERSACPPRLREEGDAARAASRKLASEHAQPTLERAIPRSVPSR